MKDFIRKKFTLYIRVNEAEWSVNSAIGYQLGRIRYEPCGPKWKISFSNVPMSDLSLLEIHEFMVALNSEAPDENT